MIHDDELTDNLGIYAAFENEFFWFSAVMIDLDGCDGEEVLDLSVLNPLYLLEFRDPQNEPLHLLIWRYNGYIRICQHRGSRPSLKKYLPSIYPDWPNYGAVGNINLQNLVFPFDAELKLRVSKLATVREPSGELLALLLWFEHGSELGFVYGNSDELLLLTGNSVNVVFEAACAKSLSEKVEVETRSFAKPLSDSNFCNNYGWFAYLDYS